MSQFLLIRLLRSFFWFWLVCGTCGSTVWGQDRIPSTQFEAVDWLETQRNTVTRNAKGAVTEIIIDYVPDHFAVGDLDIFPQLEVLEINYTGQFYDRHMSGIARLTSLKRFEVDYCDEISEASLSVLHYLPKLETVRLLNCEAVFSLEALAGCEHLKEIDLSENEHLDFRVLASLIPLQHLETLVLNNNPGLDDEHLDIIARFPHLRSLELAGCSLLTDEGIAKLSPMKLKRLNLKQNERISGIGFAKFAGSTLEELSLRECGVDDEGLLAMSNLSKLKRIDFFSNREIEGPGLAALGSFRQLERAVLSGLPLRNQHLKTMAGIETLKKLDLKFCDEISGLGLENLTSSLNLESLDLTGCRRFDVEDDFRVIGKFLGLKKLNVSHTRMRRESVSQLTSLVELEQLDVSGCNWVDDEAVAELSSLPKLTTLFLGALPRLTDQGLRELAPSTNLQSLTISANRHITGMGFSAFAESSQLATLVLTDLSQLSSAGLQNLPRLKQLRALTIQGCPITGEHLAALHGMQNLESLRIDDVPAELGSAVGALRASLPALKSYWGD